MVRYYNPARPCREKGLPEVAKPLRCDRLASVPNRMHHRSERTRLQPRGGVAPVAVIVRGHALRLTKLNFYHVNSNPINHPVRELRPHRPRTGLPLDKRQCQ